MSVHKVALIISTMDLYCLNLNTILILCLKEVQYISLVQCPLLSLRSQGYNNIMMNCPQAFFPCIRMRCMLNMPVCIKINVPHKLIYNAYK